MARRATERGRMKYEDELCIQKYILEIEGVVEAKELTGPLFSRKIINLEDMEMIQAGETRPDRARRLLNVIVLRGPNSFQAFVESLEVMGYKNLADSLKGSRSSTKELTSLLTDEETSSVLSEEVFNLKKRLAALEENGAKHEDVDVLRQDVKGELRNLTSTLQKIEELSRVSRETVTTINALTHQLDEKDKLLAAAKRQILDLESKVSGLEKQNARLKYSMEKQEKQIATLTQDMLKDKRVTERRLVAVEIERERDRREMQERFSKMEADKEKMMNVVHTLTQQLAESKKNNSVQHKQDKQEDRGLRVKIKPIIPRNRFQNNGK